MTKIIIRGAEEVQQYLEKLDKSDLNNAMMRATKAGVMVLVAQSKLNAPVDTGRLKSSITGDTVVTTPSAGHVVTGVVGSNVKYAPFMELGTGTFAGRSPHFPPPAALNTWARRHGGGSGFAVARAIWKRGGLEPRRFLQNALDSKRAQIVAIYDRSIKEVTG